MTDEEIIDLFFQRSEDALKQTDRKYRNLCYKIAWNILQNHQDGEECVNDSYLSLWNQIPPQRPDSLKIYLCRIVRNLSLKKYRDGHAGKRWAEGTLSIYELEDCIPAETQVLEEVEKRELIQVIERFLDSLGKDKRIMFVKRYWFCESIRDIAGEFGITERNASVKLGRIRTKIKHYLEREGWI